MSDLSVIDFGSQVTQLIARRLREAESLKFYHARLIRKK